MKLLTKILQKTIVLVCILISNEIHASDKLIFALDLVRHGDRTPTHEILKAPYHWKEGLGELTEKGKQQEYQLGVQFRQKYINQYHLLPQTYTSNAMYVRSTDFNRTIASAKSLLQGLYPRAVISVNTIPTLEDNLLVVKPSKNIFDQVKLYLFNRKNWKEKISGLQNKLKQWSEATGISIQDTKSLVRVADNLYVREQHNIPLPAGIDKQNAAEIILLGDALMVAAFKQPGITQPTGKTFISQVDKYLTDAKKNKNSLKYILFLAHDGTIMAVMNTLGAPVEKVPGYVSDLNFSLYKNNNNYYVEIKLNNKPVKLPKCNNSNKCTLEQFEKL